MTIGLLEIGSFSRIADFSHTKIIFTVAARYIPSHCGLSHLSRHLRSIYLIRAQGGAVVKLLKELLTSPTDVVEDLHLDVEHHQALVANARRQADAINGATEHERIQIVSALGDRVTVSRERLEVTIKRAALLVADLPVSLPPITRAIPVQYQRSGFGIRMIIPGSESAVVRKADPNLLT